MQTYHIFWHENIILENDSIISEIILQYITINSKYFDAEKSIISSSLDRQMSLNQDVRYLSYLFWIKPQCQMLLHSVKEIVISIKMKSVMIDPEDFITFSPFKWWLLLFHYLCTTELYTYIFLSAHCHFQNVIPPSE